MRQLLILALTICIASCNRDSQVDKAVGMQASGFSIKDFNALKNFPAENGMVKLDLDYTSAIDSGFVIPSARQTEGGTFILSFMLKNNTNSPKNFFYKIYYQNESYKFDELDSASKKEHEYAQNNFYGSWEKTETTFKSVLIPADETFHPITDSFRIVGNPRDEEKYYSLGKNNRWKRNPRVGRYSFLIAVADEEALKKSIPVYIQDIGQKNGNAFVNPYYYFMSGPGHNMDNILYMKSEVELKVTARPDLGAGIYEEHLHFNSPEEIAHFTPDCGQDSNLYQHAAFSQFINTINETMRFENIPEIKDVLGEPYTKADYFWNQSFHKRDELISVTPQIARWPCETVFSDAAAKKIVIKNPGSEFGKWRKESVGVISRHSFTYGKWRVKCKLSELLNKSNVWNGLTNAIWLIAQAGADSEEWNKRRICKEKGYMATYWGGRDDKRLPSVAYSEIDFEILKTPAYCPEQYYPSAFKNPRANRNNINDWNVPLPDDLDYFDDKVSVSCTNWDMACPEPKNFDIGCKPISYAGKTFEVHRWDYYYRALSSRVPERDDELFASPFYYFEIEWKPEQIIWRIGPDADHMRVVGYMDNTVTSIPDNQMLLIITQEFHNTKWWPGSPYQQQFIPFPKKDIIGEIMEVTIE
jgi:hypothetical protein